MTNYQNDIMDLLQGNTPKEKYEYLKEKLKIFEQKREIVEISLLNVCLELETKGQEMYNASGNESYVERCALHDARTLIYKLTNKCEADKISFYKWLTEPKAYNYEIIKDKKNG